MSQLDLSNIDNAKNFSIALSKFLKEKGLENAKQGLILEGLAKAFGQPNWNTFLAIYRNNSNGTVEQTSTEWNSLKNIQWDIEHTVNINYQQYHFFYNKENELLKINSSYLNYIENNSYFNISLEGLKAWGRKLNFILSQEPAKNQEEEIKLKKLYLKQKSHKEKNAICGIIDVGLFIQNQYTKVVLKTQVEKMLPFFMKVNAHDQKQEGFFEKNARPIKEPKEIMTILQELDQMFSDVEMKEREKEKFQKELATSWKTSQKSFRVLSEKMDQRSLYKWLMDYQSSQEEKKILLFDLKSLQEYAKTEYQLSPEDVLTTCISLYSKGLLSYPKTDCQYIPKSQRRESHQILNHISYNYPLFKELIQNIDKSKIGEAWDNSKVTNHTGLIPTTNQADVMSLTQHERQIYYSVCMRYIAQFEIPNYMEYLEQEEDRIYYLSESYESKGKRLRKEAIEGTILESGHYEPNLDEKEKIIWLNNWKIGAEDIQLENETIKITEVIQSLSDDELYLLMINHVDLTRLFSDLVKERNSKVKSNIFPNLLIKEYQITKEIMDKLIDIIELAIPKNITKKNLTELMDYEINSDGHVNSSGDFIEKEVEMENEREIEVADIIRNWEMDTEDIIVKDNKKVKKVQIARIVNELNDNELSTIIMNQINLKNVFDDISTNPKNNDLLIEKYKISKETIKALIMILTNSVEVKNFK